MAIEMSSIRNISDLESVVDSIIYDLDLSKTSGETLAVALELRAMRWALVGQPDDEDRDTITDRLVTAIDSATDHLSDKSDEVAGAIDNLTEVFLPPEPPMPRWYRVYRWLRD
jgi:hypothetical protein